MTASTIILGQREGILRLPKAALRRRAEWSQRDSDVLAHLIQVHAQIQQSRWYKSDICFQAQGEAVLASSFPAFQDFVFAAVYFRQLIASNDHLLKDAVARYRRFVDCPIRSDWVRHELDSFNKALAGSDPMMPGYTVRELFEAFMYGASLMHTVPPENDPVRKCFLDIYDKQPRHLLIFSFNMSLKLLMNRVGNVAIVIYRDYSHWLRDYGLPLPDIRWHGQLFDCVAAVNSGDTTNSDGS